MSKLHLLEDAYAKLDRAEEHLETLKTEVRKFRKGDPYEVSSEADADSGEYVLRIHPDEPPKRIAVLVGDVLNNLRPALDYLVSALATLDAGKAYGTNQFPICDKPAVFQAEVTKKGRLQGLNPDHITLIEKLQPYPRRKAKRWLRELRELSNPDKHVRLNVLAGHVEADFDFGPIAPPSPPKPVLSASDLGASVAQPELGRIYSGDLVPSAYTAPGGSLALSGSLVPDDSLLSLSSGGTISLGESFRKLGENLAAGTKAMDATFKALQVARTAAIPQAKTSAPQSEVDVYLSVTILVAFTGGTPVVETMEILHSQVSKTIKTFKREFR